MQRLKESNINPIKLTFYKDLKFYFVVPRGLLLVCFYFILFSLTFFQDACLYYVSKENKILTNKLRLKKTVNHTVNHQNIIIFELFKFLIDENQILFAPS